MFTKATRNDTYIKLALTGPSGSGKTYSGLKLARGLTGPAGKIAVIDTENGSSKLYSDLTDFDHCDLASHKYTEFLNAVKAAEQAGYDAVIIDSLSHLWQSILDEKAAIDRKGGNQYTNWSVPTQHLNETVQVILQAKIHVFACLRSKTDYVMETNTKGKEVPKKVGTAPVMRDGIDYEFTLCLDIGMDHNATPSKDRTGLFVDKTFQITERTGEQIAGWLSGSEPVESTVDHEETDHFLNLIHNADSKESLGKIGQQIKTSTLPESAKDIIRKVYRERFNSLAAV
jgi:nucleoside-triphosphatase THEP1